MKVKVSNLTSPSSGKEVANQFQLEVGSKVYFQSYQTIIAVYDRRTGKTVLDKNAWDYSTTTGKYRNDFLGEKRPETERKIKNGTYKLRDLNR